jgi:dihydrofolate synthase/folylpolyglutamate synthase
VGSPVTLGDALEWLDRHVNLEQISREAAGRYAVPTLERMRALAAVLGDPQGDYPVIHVTGTNGKGSTTRMIASLLRAQGVSTGVMTSPQPRVNDRIATDSGPISDQALAEELDSLRLLEGFLLERDHGADPPSWFELVTAVGLRHFSDAAVEAAVIEVGLGGRFDATNVVDADVAVVTNVELDHVEVLGPDRESIATEKAGIIKAGSAAIVGEIDEEIAAIFVDAAAEVGARAVWRRGIDFDCIDSVIAHGGRLLDLRTPGATYDGIYVPLFGAHQAQNAAVALAATEAFFARPLDQAVVEEAFAATTNPGRLEVASRHPLVILDGAHNQAGATALGRALEEDFAAVGGVVLVLGCLRGRDPFSILEGIGTGHIRQVIATAPESLRALPPEAVADAAEAAGLPVEIVVDVADAVDRASALVAPDDAVLVAGSLYVVWEASRALRSSRGQAGA